MGLLFVAFFASMLFYAPPGIQKWLDGLEEINLDLQLPRTLKPLSEKNVPIVIVDIDDKSIDAKGRWPWPRKILAGMVEQLYASGAAVVAFDMAFITAEANIADEVIGEITQREGAASGPAVAAIEEVKPFFDNDAIFAQSLAKGDAVLGYIFTPVKETEGLLPPPLLELSSELADHLDIPVQSGYEASLPLLGKAAPSGGFINAQPDPDGVFRSTSLVLRYGNGIYPSVALEAASRYLLTKEVKLLTGTYDDSVVLEGISLDGLVIPTDHTGRILIPFRGPPFSFPYFSALDVIDAKVNRNELEGKLVFIGSTAAGMADLKATALSPVFPGIEIQATIAQGIVDHYLPYRPTWGKGVTLATIVIFGTLCALFFPYVGPLGDVVLGIILPVLLVTVNRYVWLHYEVIYFVILPVLLIEVLFIFNIAYGYLFESGKRKQMKQMFAQYVPPTYLETMLSKGGNFGLEGETKELSVLFADIRNFTGISEKLTAAEVKKLLSDFLTPMTEVIFDHRGTIDKYVGDMVMAFWGAPLQDLENAKNAVTCSLAMQKKLKELNVGRSIPIHIGIGINTGVMNVGDMGSKFRRAYTVLGDAVNLASRLEALSKDYHAKIVVGENTWLQSNEHFIYRKLDKVKVKGKSEPVAIYEPLCAKQDASAELLSILEVHDRALQAYFSRDWEGAEKGFGQLKGSHPQDADLYDVYLERIKHFRSAPPGADWDGSFTREKK